jgi:hypothetical protein
VAPLSLARLVSALAASRMRTASRAPLDTAWEFQAALGSVGVQHSHGHHALILP